MHDRRNFVVIILLMGSAVWAFVGWTVLASPFGEAESWVWWHRGLSTAGVVIFGGWLFYALNFEDTHPDKLREIVGEIYYDADGLAFMPTVRINENGQAELSVYYQNRFENDCCAVIHLRPPDECFVIKPGARDVHIAFKADGGDFGVIHQPIAVPSHLQGEVINLEVAAATRFPHTHGKRLRSHEGLEVGSVLVDWDQAFKAGVHEVSGELELTNPAHVHLSMPHDVADSVPAAALWKQERILAGNVT